MRKRNLWGLSFIFLTRFAGAVDATLFYYQKTPSECEWNLLSIESKMGDYILIAAEYDGGQPQIFSSKTEKPVFENNEGHGAMWLPFSVN